MSNFIKAFNADLKLNNPKMADALEEIGKTCDTVNQQRHEIFADMFAHATGPGSVNPYSNLLKAAFPNSLTEMIQFVEENALK